MLFMVNSNTGIAIVPTLCVTTIKLTTDNNRSLDVAKRNPGQAMSFSPGFRFATSRLLLFCDAERGNDKLKTGIFDRERYTKSPQNNV